MICQAIMKLNMNKPQRNAITIQISSTRSMGSFHQIRCSGGVTAIASPPDLKSLGKRDGGDLHHPPENVENGGERDAEEEEQEWIVQDALHDRNSLRFFGSARRNNHRHRGTSSG